jgi:adenylate cyclase
MPLQSDLPNLELRLRTLLPADLYAAMWIDPSADNLRRVFDHLRTMQHILLDYVPRQVSNRPPAPGQPQYAWQAGSLMFTDLAGFTPLLAAMAPAGHEGAQNLTQLLNRYFTTMIEIIGKSGGSLLEFTGDALLVQFKHEQGSKGEATDKEIAKDTEKAIYAGLRMQRAMAAFANIDTPQGQLSLKMRLGIHSGRFITADIGTPMRMAHVLLGRCVQVAKHAEGAGEIGRVSLTAASAQNKQNSFRLEPTKRYALSEHVAHHLPDHLPDHLLVVDDFSPTQLGEYDISLNRRRMPSAILFDRSAEGILGEIKTLLQSVEPLASYLPTSILQLLVNTAAERHIPAAFPTIAVAFVNLMGIPEAVDDALDGEIEQLVNCFSHAFALINGVVEYRGGILQQVAYHSIGSELLIHFGMLNPDPSDPVRAAQAMLEIQQVVAQLEAPTVQGKPIHLTCRIGMTYGPVFATEVGESRGRRGINILGDTVNTAARLMGKADSNQILMSQRFYDEIAASYQCQPLGTLALKGKAKPEPVFGLVTKLDQPLN